MAVINLHERYEKQIITQYTKESVISGKTSKEYNFDGVKGIHISTPLTIPLVDYKRSGLQRYGETTEMGDRIQFLEMRQDKSFSLSIDKGNQSDQQYIKEAGRVMKLQQAEQVVPLIDRYSISEYCKNAGIIKGMATPSKANVVSSIFDMETAMTNSLIPTGDRYMYIGGTIYNMVRLSTELIRTETFAKEDFEKGVVGMIANFKVVLIPDNYLPAGVHFLATHKRSVLQPVKLHDAKIHTDPPGISGALLEGRYYFDAFVLGERANGVYAAVETGKKTANPTITQISGNNATVSGTSGVTKYTVDGSDPRYSKSAQIYTSSTIPVPAKATLKIVSTDTGKFASDVIEKTNA